MHIISASQFNLDSILSYNGLFGAIQNIQNNQTSYEQTNRVIATYFHESSTRTRLSFEAAICKLGGKYISVENAKESSSSTKGESIEDTIKTIANYAELIVLRHSEIGSAAKAAKVSTVPIINAGDGAGEHPTQALIDLYTIWKRRNGQLKNLNVTILGSGKARTINSLMRLLKQLPGINITEITNFQDEQDLMKVAECDVLYMTRIQRERFSETENKPIPTILQKEILKKMKKNAMILNPLPRQEELPIEIDNDPRAAYWEQVHNGLYVRIVLLEDVFSGNYRATYFPYQH